LNKKLTVFIKGKEHEWQFEFMGNPEHLDEWREDGLEVYEVGNSIPKWVADSGLTKLYCFLQDLFNFNLRK
jgi:hypothetical protein